MGDQCGPDVVTVSVSLLIAKAQNACFWPKSLLGTARKYNCMEL